MEEQKCYEFEALLIDNPTFNINEWFGYVYLTVHTSGIKYIGKKSFFSKQNKKLGKKELASLPITRGRKPTTKEVITESNWKNYYGSADEVKKLDPNDLKRYVLKLCKTKKELTYWETYYLFINNVLLSNEYINDNILGTFYRKDFDLSK